MLLFLISCFSFLLLSKVGSRLWAFPSFLFCIFVPLFTKGMFFTPSFEIPRMFPYTHKNMRPKREILEETKEFSLLDLPDLALDSILDKLDPSELCSMARVCYFLREKCTSDHFWAKHFKQKWGGVVGDSFYREWQCYVASRRVPRFLNSRVQKGGFLQFFFGIFLNKLQMKERDCVSRCFLPVNSVMSCYLALETGKFWFPAQVFNRENGHIGFVLSCYDAKLSYDSTSDNFVARYPSHGKSMIEEDIEWDRIRAPSVDTPANATHVSTCLDELKPDDHVEIQWRRSKEFPYGWWYGVVGHIESCTAYNNESHCQCHINDIVILEFKQYSVESQWRKVSIFRKDHTETGDGAVGFYGGIRKVSKKEEIESWRHLWPDCTLE
ncbi:F-box protein At2g26850-like isoform X2 [Primulina eburnea]|uniref:F-box protein At2g26850-like isoform X2 n=1 Tax=Primulina eburnea TaxID=1245227 RepID=UPI003C6C4F06